MTDPHDRSNELPEVQALDTQLVTLCQHLLSLHCPFDPGDETLLARHGRVSDGALQVGQMRYRAVVLPDLLTLRAGTLALLQQFAAAGGVLLAAGRLPDRIDGALDSAASDLAALVRRAPNERDALQGTELEAIYVIGEFGVWGAPSTREPRPRCVRLGPRFGIGAEPETTSGDLVSEGHPFYAGRLRLIKDVHLATPAEGERTVLCLPGIDAAALARVSVNGAEAGIIAWPPYELEITGHIQGGDNEIAIELVATLRNLLAPHHRPEGEPDQCWDRDYLLRPEWLDDPEPLRARWTDDYFFLRFGLAEGA